MTREPTFAEISEVLRYEPKTGMLFWVAPPKRGRAKPGEEAGCVTLTGYRQVGFRRRYYRAHRIAWLLSTGSWPSELIDHVNGDKLDNRLGNLREATHAQNMANMRRPSTNVVGKKGVSFHRPTGRWQARIKADGKQRHIGFFDTPDAAHSAYCAAASKYFGQFARAA